MNPIALSDVACLGDKDVTHQIAEELDLDGVELTPFRLFDRESYDDVLSFHGSPFAVKNSLSTRLRHGPVKEIPLALLWQVFIGPLFGTPGLKISQRFEIPLVLHQESILELAKAGKLRELKGINVSVENSNFTRHPLVKGDPWESFFQALLTATELLPEVDVVIDLEHLAQTCWPEEADLAGFCKRVSRIAPIAELHICDSVPGDAWKGHLIPGRGIMPIAQQIAFFAAEYPKAVLVLEHKPTISMLKYLPLSTKARYRAVVDEVAEALDFVRSALV